MKGWVLVEGIRLSSKGGWFVVLGGGVGEGELFRLVGGFGSVVGWVGFFMEERRFVVRCV